MDIRPGKLIAVDLGLARIGVATCDPLGITVRPLATISRGSRQADFERLAALVSGENGGDEAEAVVVGLPLSMDGSESEQTKITRNWALRLARALRTARRSPVPIIFWDERLSSFAAQEMMAADPRRAQAIGEDAYAAAVILRSYLEARRRGEGERWGGIVLEKK